VNDDLCRILDHALPAQPNLNNCNEPVVSAPGLRAVVSAPGSAGV